MIDYKKAAAIAAKYNAKLEEFIEEYNVEMFAAFGARYCRHWANCLIPALGVSAAELEAIDELIVDVVKLRDTTSYMVSVDGERIWLVKRRKYDDDK